MKEGKLQVVVVRKHRLQRVLAVVVEVKLAPMPVEEGEAAVVQQVRAGLKRQRSLVYLVRKVSKGLVDTLKG